jgi:hypothetical protein
MNYEEFFNKVKNLLLAKVDDKSIPYAKHVYGRFSNSFYCPCLQFLTLDALESSEWTNGIRDNSVYVRFSIDMQTKKLEVHTCGHVWISDADKKAYVRDSYLAMHSVCEIAKRNGVKCIRKQSFKTEEECAEKIAKVYNAIMEQVVDYCDGVYPYEKGVKMLKSAK